MFMDLLVLKEFEIISYEDQIIEDEEYLVFQENHLNYSPKCPYCSSQPRVHLKNIEKSETSTLLTKMSLLI